MDSTSALCRRSVIVDLYAPIAKRSSATNAAAIHGILFPFSFLLERTEFVGHGRFPSR